MLTFIASILAFLGFAVSSAHADPIIPLAPVSAVLRTHAAALPSVDLRVERSSAPERAARANTTAVRPRAVTPSQTSPQPAATAPAKTTQTEQAPKQASPTPAAQPVSAPQEPRTAPAASQPAAAAVPAAASMSPLELAVVAATNAERTKHGLASLTADNALAAIARAHSADMLAKNYFSHTNKSGCSASCRMTNAGYAWKSMGENIYWMSGYDLGVPAAAKKIVDSWMASAGHRANILNSTFTHVGVGVAQSGSKTYVTQNFSVPR